MDEDTYFLVVSRMADYFDGRMPRLGETVELVYVKDTHDGSLAFQLRVKNASPDHK